MSGQSKQLYCITGIDAPGRLETRLAVRPDHLAYWGTLGTDLLLAGPFLDAAEKPCGSLIVVRAESLAAAQALAEADPYNANGVFARVSAQRWNWTINAPEGV